MDATQTTQHELHRMMLDYETQARELLVLGERIKQAVNEIGKTQIIGGLRARVNSPKKSYDWEGTARRNATEEQIANHTTTKETTKWKDVCYELDLKEDDVPFTEGKASVTLTLI